MSWASEALERIQEEFEAARNPERAAPMARYMRDQFPFLGIPAPQQRVGLRQAMAGMGLPTEDDLAELLGLLWGLPEREYQYAGLGVLGRQIRSCGPGFIHTVRRLVTTKSWWDTVDALAKSGSGALVLRYPELAETMDRWAESDEMWLRRTAILHQLGFKERTDSGRLFRYCRSMAHEQEFFIRKAIGWALREYSKADADAVRAFVATHDGALSGLSKREALLWLNGGRAAKRRGAETDDAPAPG